MIHYCIPPLQELTGSNFGPDPIATSSYDTVARVVDFANFLTGVLLPPPPYPPVFSWSPSSILVFTSLQSARVRVRLESKSWTGWSQNTSVSAWNTFQSLAPSLSSLVGSITGVSTYGTTGTTFATAQVQNMLSATAIQVVVGGVNAQLVNPVDGTPLTATSAVPVVRNTATSDGTVSISFNIPPGQGSSNSIQV